MLILPGVKMPENCFECGIFGISDVVGLQCPCDSDPESYSTSKRSSDCPLIEIPDGHGRLIDANALTVQMERNLWAIEDKAEKELGFDETLRRGMQYGHAVCLNAVNTAPVVFMPQIVRCCECEYNNHCLTQEFVEEECRTPFDKNTWFCADAKAAPTVR